MSETVDNVTEAEQTVEVYNKPVPPELNPTREESTPSELNLDMIRSVPVNLSIEIGQTSISIGELLALAPGAVVELDRRVGEPLDVLVNGSLIARGEIVVVRDYFGIRFTDIVSPMQRVQGLR